MNPAPTATTATTAADILQRLGACQAARDWADARDPETAWRDCQRGDWLLWAAARIKLDRRLLVAAACQCARLALPHVPAGETRPLAAIETAARWADGLATDAEVRSAATAAAYAAAAARAAAATTYAYADAAYAYSAAYAAAAARAAAATTYAYADAASAAALAECACRVRAVIPWATVAAAIEGGRQ